MRSLLLVFVGGLTAAACGSSSSSGDTSGSGDDAGVDAGTSFPADHPALPQVVTEGGPVLTAPKFVSITFPGDTLVSQIDDFSSKIGAGAYWSATTSEYGVGPGTSSAVHLTTAPTGNTISDDQIQQFLKDNIGTTLPANDPNTLYALYYPDGITVELQGGVGCTDFGAYHGDVNLGGGKFAAYAVMPRCPPPFPGITTLDQLTASASHEYIEAATDPVATDKPAYGNADAQGGGWALAGGGAEIGDMCAELGDVFTKGSDVPYLVQRVWSNAAATASHDPCVPEGAAPYFNSAPVLPDTVQLDIGTGKKQTLNVVNIPVGQSKSIELDLFSDGDTGGPWTVSALDFGSALMGGTPNLEFSFDNTTGQNGDKINMTITSKKKDPNGFAAFFIENQMGTGCNGNPTASNCTTTFWVALVQQ